MRFKEFLKLLLPFDRFVITTRLKPKEAVTRLKRVVEPQAFIRLGLWSRDHLPYEGRVTDDSFYINRIIHYRNPSRPFIYGKIRSEGDRARIAVIMHMDIIVMIFAIVWLASSVDMLFRLLNSVQQLGDSSRIMGLILIGVPLVMYLIAISLYRVEAEQSKKYLSDLFRRTVVESPPSHTPSLSLPLSRPLYLRDQLTRPGEKPKRRRW